VYLSPYLSSKKIPQRPTHLRDMIGSLIKYVKGNVRDPVKMLQGRPRDATSYSEDNHVKTCAGKTFADRNGERNTGRFQGNMVIYLPLPDHSRSPLPQHCVGPVLEHGHPTMSHGPRAFPQHRSSNQTLATAATIRSCSDSQARRTLKVLGRSLIG